jgi:hypothetical protein
MQIPTLAHVFKPSLRAFARLAFALRPLRLAFALFTLLVLYVWRWLALGQLKFLSKDVEVENFVETSIHEKVVEIVSGSGQNTIDDCEGSRSEHDSDENEDDEASDGGADAAVAFDADTHTYCFGSSTVMMGRIREMVALKYFAEGDGRAPGEETVSKPEEDKVVVFEHFFIAGLLMPPHSAIEKIMFKFRVHLHQLMPNAIVQLSKFFWAMGTCGGSPMSEVYAKRYELHYQPKKVHVEDEVLNTQFGCLNIHAKCYKDSELKLTMQLGTNG